MKTTGILTVVAYDSKADVKKGKPAVKYTDVQDMDSALLIAEGLQDDGSTVILIKDSTGKIVNRFKG